MTDAMTRPTRGGVPARPPEGHLRGYLLAAFAAVCWASGGLTARWLFTRASVEVDPVVLSAARAWAAFLLALAYLSVARRSALRIGVRDVPFLGAFGVFGLAAVHFTYFKAISLTNVATAILLEYLAPVLVLLVSVGFLRKRVTWTLPAAVALSVSGCALMVGVFGGRLVVSRAGVGWGLASAVFFAGYTLMGEYAASRYTAWTLLVYGLGAASLFWTVFLGGFGRILALASDPTRFAAVLFLAVVSTLAPFGAFLTALNHIDATRATITATLEPVVAAALAFALLGETLTPLQLLGGALVVGAILVSQAPGPVEPQLPPGT